jgi:anti-anti-sigma regulatory factor
MKLKELAITVTPQQGLPHVTIQGKVDSWHARTVEDVFESFVLQDTPQISVDISRASFVDVESLSSLVRALRIASTDMRMALVAADSTVDILKKAGLGPEIAVMTADEAGVDESSAPREYYSSRWTPPKTNQDELPLAA